MVVWAHASSIESYSQREWSTDGSWPNEGVVCVCVICRQIKWLLNAHLFTFILYLQCWRSVALHSIRRIIIIIKSIACNFSSNVICSFFVSISLRKCFELWMRQKECQKSNVRKSCGRNLSFLPPKSEVKWNMKRRSGRRISKPNNNKRAKARTPLNLN